MNRNIQIKKLHDCATIIAGQSPESKYYNTNGDGVPFFQGKADFGEKYPIIRVYCTNPTKMAEKDDILLSVRAPVGPTNLSPGNVCIGRGLSAIRPHEELNLHYLLCYFKYFEAQLSAKGTGTTFKAITQSVLKNLDVPIPSLSEQERIVSRIEELFSELDNAVETLNATKKQLEVYRQAVLKDVFTIRNGEHCLLSTLMVGSPQNGIYKPKSLYGDGTAILRIDGFYDGKILHDYEFKHVKLDDQEIDTYKLNINDLVVNRVNSMPYLGKCALVRSLKETTVFESNMMRIKLNEELILPEYITYFLSSSMGRKELTKNAKQAVNQASINQTDVGNAIIPIPKSIQMQQQMVDVIQAKLSVCESIENTVDSTLAQASAIRQSILKQAFEGGLQ